MRQFQYKAISHDGHKSQGIVEARDEEQAVRILRDKNYLITEIKDPHKALSYALFSQISKISDKDIIAFTRQLASMLNAGLPITQSLHLIKKQFKPAMQAVIDDISSGIESGLSLYESLKKHSEVFPKIYLALVKAGEMAGVLGIVLDRLSTNLENQGEFKAKVKSAMVYPVIVLAAMFVVGLIMIFFVMPQMSELYSQFGTDLPFMTKIVLGVSGIVKQYWYLMVLLIAGLIGSFIYIKKTDQGKSWFDRKILKLPIVGPLVTKVISTDVIMTFSLLNQSGVSIVESLEVVAEATGNSVYESTIKEASKKVEKGVSLGSSFANEEIFPEAVIQMIIVGEETGKLSEMLEKIGIQFEKESLLALKTLTSSIEPILIIVLGIGVAIMAISIIFPIYNLTGSM